MPSGPDGAVVRGVADAVAAGESETVAEEEGCGADCSAPAGAELAHPANKTAPSETAEMNAEYFTDSPIDA